jgi:glycosyltransferase involved in cell wall biosynthesis
MKVLFVTNDAINQKRAGPAVRCLELARMVANRHEVTLASTQPSDLDLQGIRLLADALQHKSRLKLEAKTSDVVVTQGLVLARYPFLARLARHLVIDLYDPYLLEYLQHAHPKLPHWGYMRQWYRLNQQMQQGDFFLCANERQWDYWLGRLCALGRLNLDEYNRDASFKSLLAVVPFGLSNLPPQHKRHVMKGVMPGIGEKDTVLLWAGGIWQWLDPLVVIRAMQEVSFQRNDVKLVFMGGKDPNPANRAMPIAEKSRKLSAELGLLGKWVFFHEDWVPYDERQNYLLEADVGISAHPDTVESRYAFRTRVLDYIWAGLPMILTQGDSFGDFVTHEGVGWALPPGDVKAWRNAILALAQSGEARQDIRSRLQNLASRFHWSKVAEPLLNYCGTPYRTSRASRLRGTLAPLLSSGYDMTKGMGD